MARIRIEHLWKRYGPVEAVRDLSLACADGLLLALLGPSGCGKTSTLKMLAGIEDVSTGAIFFDDRPVNGIEAAARNVAMVFEDYALYPHLTVAQNIAFPLEIRRRPRDEIRRATDGVIALLGLDTLRDTSVRALSGGAQQRVGIGRALVRQPDVLLFDEPLSHLDGAQKSGLRAEIKRLQKEAGVTSVLVTHDQTEAMAMADHVAVMDQGVLQQVGTPDDLYERPANLFVAQFIGEPPMNLLPGRLERRADGLVLHGPIGALALPEAAAPPLEDRASSDVVVGVRAEHLRLSDAASGSPGLPGAVFFREPRGDFDVVVVQVDGSSATPLAVEVEPAARWRAGDRVRVGVADARLHVFDSLHGTRR
ncbi:MAG TPA: ABC transporter ATP-binding protein [Methylomirabilota bacterium]|nr:ABC transporter ATP-binding protein [Methylomirabilota bacterium]